jgi:hypothetical protein
MSQSETERKRAAASWLGRGYESVPGKPFQWAWHQEREEIRAHLRRRAARFGADCLARARMEFRITAIQQRLHRNKPTFAERQAAWKAKWEAARPPSVAFTADELDRIAERFAGSNDETGMAIAAKAQAQREGIG